MKYLLLLLAIYGACVAETSVMPALKLGTATPDLLMVVALAWMFSQRGARGFAGAALAGLASDLNSAGRLGPGLGAVAIAAWTSEHMRRKLPLENAIGQALFSLPTVALALGLAASAQSLIAGDPVAWKGLLQHACQGSLSTAALALPVLLLSSSRRRTKRVGRWTLTPAR